MGMTSFPVHKQTLITRKRQEIDQKLYLIANRKLDTAFQNPPPYFTCDATWRRNGHDVIAGLQTNAINSETVRDRPKVINNRE